MNLPEDRRRGTGRVEMAMTPMIDVVFNLIIFFMLMPSFEATEGYLPTNLPGTTSGPHVRLVKEALRVDLRHPESPDDSGSPAEVELNREPVAGIAGLRRGLFAAAHRLRTGNTSLKEVPVVIAPGATVRHREVTGAFDAAIDAGFVEIRFTVPQ